MNFREKAHSVKADVAAPSWSSATAVSFAMLLPSALSVVSPLPLVARCIMRSVLVRTRSHLINTAQVMQEAAYPHRIGLEKAYSPSQSAEYSSGTIL